MSTEPLPATWRGLVDDAAIFPPGDLPLGEAAAAHRAHRDTPYADLVGSFVVRDTDLPSLKAYIESNASLAGWAQFRKPIWLTEFSCNGDATVAQQEAFMRVAIPYLEAQPNVFRYSWFSAGPIPNAELVNDDGTPTDLGDVYMGLDRACDR